MVIGTDYIGNWKSNYHTIMTTTSTQCQWMLRVNRLQLKNIGSVGLYSGDKQSQLFTIHIFIHKLIYTSTCKWEHQ
jgi:hypothetical protein